MVPFIVGVVVGMLIAAGVLYAIGATAKSPERLGPWGAPDPRIAYAKPPRLPMQSVPGRCEACGEFQGHHTAYCQRDRR